MNEENRNTEMGTVLFEDGKYFIEVDGKHDELPNLA